MGCHEALIQRRNNYQQADPTFDFTNSAGVVPATWLPDEVMDPLLVGPSKSRALRGNEGIWRTLIWKCDSWNARSALSQELITAGRAGVSSIWDNDPRVDVVCCGPKQQGRSDLQVPKLQLFAQAMCPTRSRPASITGRTSHRLIVHAVNDMLVLTNKSSDVRIVQ